MVELSSCSPVTGKTIVTNNTNSPNSSVLGSDQTNTNNDSQTYRTTDSSNRNILQTTKESDNNNLENNIVKHVKETAFRKFKFPPENTFKNYKDDKRNNQIPDSFPGTVLITDTQDLNSENRYQLHKDYRQKSSPEFKYFMKRILGAVSPKQTNFKRKSVRMTVSNIFTPSDEAFALLFLYNHYDSWLNTTKGTRLRKKFTDGKSGNKEGWSNEGQELYKYLVSELEEQREEQQSKELETELLEMYQKQNGNHKQQDKEEDEETAQLHGTYFKCEDEDERDTSRVSQLDVFQHSDPSFGTNDNNGNDARGGQDPLAFAIQRKRERIKKLPTKATKKLFPSLSKGMHLVKIIDPGYGWKIEVGRDSTAKPPALPPTPEKIEKADLLNTFDWLAAPLPPKYKDDNHFKQDWFMGIYMYQLPMTNHCPEWVGDEPTCATNFASMEFPIFARDTEDMEASAAGPDIELAQTWENPSTINSKATWDSQSHEHPHFAKSQEKILPPPYSNNQMQRSKNHQMLIHFGIVPRLTPMVVPLVALQLQQQTSFVPLRPYLTISSVFHITFQQTKEHVIVVPLETSVTILNRTQSDVELPVLTLRAHVITGFSTDMIAKSNAMPLGTFERSMVPTHPNATKTKPACAFQFKYTLEHWCFDI
eukprot:jgi/Psemu1/28554/gm1.28554_g